MGKHYLQLVPTLLLLFSPFARQFSKHLVTRKIHTEQCLALYSRWWTQHTHACFQLGLSAVQTSEPTSKTWGNRHIPCFVENKSFDPIAIPFLFCCCVTYCIMYRIVTNCIGIYVSYHGKMCPIWWRRGIRHKMKERGRATAKEKNKCTPRYRPATMHRFIMIFLATIQVYCILTIRYHNICVQYNYIYASTNMGNHCLQLVLCPMIFCVKKILEN